MRKRTRLRVRFLLGLDFEEQICYYDLAARLGVPLTLSAALPYDRSWRAVVLFYGERMIVTLSQ